MWSSRCEIGWPMLIETRQHRKPGAKVGDDLRLWRELRLEVDLDFGGMNALGMLVEFRAAGAPADRS